jgi:hypothetical protein
MKYAGPPTISTALRNKSKAWSMYLMNPAKIKVVK